MPEDDDRDLLAAEYVLGLLDPDEAAAAEARLRAEPGFRAAVAAWAARLGPLAETARDAAPGDDVRARIMALALAANDAAPLADLARSRGRWRGIAAGASVAAAALALVIGVQTWRGSPADEPPVAATEPARPVLVASLSSADSTTSLAVAYDPREGALLVSPGQVTPAAGHDHQLWIIPEGGSPASLGLIRAETARRVDVPGALAPHFRRDASIALSVEPTGGSPTGRPTGAIVAHGKLNEI